MVKNNIVLHSSISTFPQPEEEIFLLYSKGFEHGPGIQRTGKGSPFMDDKFYLGGGPITDPIMQRTGSWYLSPEYKNADKLLIEKELRRLEDDLRNYEKLLQDGLTRREENVYATLRDTTLPRIKYRKNLLSTLQDNPGFLKDYLSEFYNCYPNHEIVGMQGCGNLSMNEWYVAFLNSEFTEGKHTLIYLPQEAEHMQGRQYTCLVKWKKGNKIEERPLTIEKILFSIYNEHEKENIVFSVDKGQDITNDIEFAVYGTQLVENGRLVTLREKIIEISDIRHVYKLINVNPKDDDMWPIRYFGEYQYDDMWFGERHLLRNVEDVRRLALTGPIKLDCNFENMGADIDKISKMLIEGGYNDVKEEGQIISPGQFKKSGKSVIEVYLPRNVYAYSMMGVDVDGNLSALAIGGKAGQLGQQLEGAAQNMLNYGLRIGTRDRVYTGPGIKNALLIDQGNDVFQKVMYNKKKGLEDVVRPERSQLRAVFVFARKKT